MIFSANKKKKFKKAVILFVIIGIAVIGMLFAKVIIPAQNATKKYNIAVKEYNNEAEKYNEAAEKASLDNIDGLPVKADTLGSVSESYFAVIKSLLNGNSKAKIKKDISNCDRMYVENIPLSLLKNVSTNRNVHLAESSFRAGSDTI